MAGRVRRPFRQILTRFAPYMRPRHVRIIPSSGHLLISSIIPRRGCSLVKFVVRRKDLGLDGWVGSTKDAARSIRSLSQTLIEMWVKPESTANGQWCLASAAPFTLNSPRSRCMRRMADSRALGGLSQSRKHICTGNQTPSSLFGAFAFSPFFLGAVVSRLRLVNQNPWSPCETPRKNAFMH